MKDPLFFIAILPDKQIQDEVTGFKQFCAERFGARHSLTSPPHITIVPPFGWPKPQLQVLKDALDDFVVDHTPFDIQLVNFGSFPPRVLFVGIGPNKQLAKMAGNLAIHLKETIGLEQTSSHGFNPHMTIAHRDLQKEVFPNAWAYFSKQTYQRTFTAEGLTFLRYGQGQWELEETFFFS